MFKKNFMWGTATAAYQIEGGAHEDGRGLSVWDVFCAEGNAYAGHTGDVACDHYHRFAQDIALMKELGINSYRFSLSWPRIIPNGTGEINQKGIDFYNALIDELIKNGITPIITLFHWDYPYELEKKGGWRNRESSEWFAEYAEVVFKNFSDRVKYFVTLNEPQCFIGQGYAQGIHAPGLRCSDRDIVTMAHNVMLAHGKAVKKLREIAPDCKIGYAPTASAAIPATDSKENIEAARASFFDIDMNNWTWNVSWWSDPIMLGRYPEETKAFEILGKYLPESYKEDLEIISQPIDFYCQNIYNGARFRKGENGPQWVPNSINMPLTNCNWPVVPESLYWGPKFLYERYGKPIIISENGMAGYDAVSLDGSVHDADRIDFIHKYLLELERAIDDGIEIDGYMYWSLMDNFEWSKGYSVRFGLIHIDYITQKRTPKDSFYWYRDVIKTGGESLHRFSK